MAEPPTEGPDLSVAMVTHNGREKALRTLGSARRATDSAIVEWFVVDCASSDGTSAAVRERFPDVDVSAQSNLGFAAGANVALRRARGRYVLLLNPDVEILDGRLSQIVAALDRRPQVAAAGVVHQSPDGQPLPSMGRDPSALRQAADALHLGRVTGLGELETRPGRYTKERPADWVVGAFMVLRREALEEVGALDERFFLYCEEKDWCYRARRAGWEIRHLPIMTIAHDTPAQTEPILRAQLAYAKLQFARKHLGAVHRVALQAALVAGHAVRLAFLAPAVLLDARFRARVDGERRALAVGLGAAAPRFPHTAA